MRPFDEEHIFPRFAKVFEQAYTRFLDLQTAESQAREARIEASLERIRSRTMAMQQSEELAEVSFLLNQEVRSLGTKTWGCAFNIYGENESTEWFGTEAGIIPTYKTPREGIFHHYYEIGQRGESFHIEEFSGEKQKAHYEYMMTLPVLGDILKDLKAAGHAFPASQFDHVAYFKYGYLLFITLEPTSKEHDVFKRFAKVFEQTYTRFLDLKQAEAQTRESEIEAALERVRARSMTMQHSDQLDQVSTIFHEQLLQLGIESEFSYVWLPDEAASNHMFWAAWSEGNDKSKKTASKTVVYPLDKKEPYTAACFEAWESNDPVHISRIPPDEVEHFFQTWDELISGADHLQSSHFQEGLYYAEAYMKYGCFGINIRRLINDEEHKILLRFAIEFERTYTRFLDLKQAEAQARESEIEAALERIRSRTMAMHSSHELPEVANLLFIQIQSLGIPVWSTAYNILSEDGKSSSCSVSSEGQIQPSFRLPLTEEKSFIEWHKAVQRGDELFVQEWAVQICRSTINISSHFRRYSVLRNLWRRPAFPYPLIR